MYKDLDALLVRYLIIIILVSVILLLPACGNHTYHVVKPGDTLYSIGWAYGYDYKQIAVWNDIDEPFSINDGEIIKLVPPKRIGRSNSAKQSKKNVVDVSVKHASIKQSRDNSEKGLNYDSSGSLRKNVGSNKKNKNEKNNDVKNTDVKDSIKNKTINKNHTKKIVWKWPTIGKNIVQYFVASDIRKRGVKISGRNGQSIRAAAAGRVVYSGSGLIGYGRLIIIKHDSVYLSAYAHNRELLVREGDAIKLGQKIATMGSSGTDRVMLHFEIRRKGVPVNPLNFLPRAGALQTG
ncbi:MAG: peptidoglycan DD-metalloendopeptidase family protein [Gammaproteobacteria bacterium]|nr:peptidoglycan DD-metalloendopeptidase family protein [Gammaproteobacteria bacterium]